MPELAPASARRYERIDIALRCRLFIREGSAEGSSNSSGRKTGQALRFEAFATSRNLGLGGVFVESGFQLRPNVRVTLELHLPNGPLAIASRVAHVIGPGGAHPPGMGLEFAGVDNHGRETLLRYCTPQAYRDFHRAISAEFPDLARDFGLDDVSIVINLWEESRVRRGATAPAADRRRTLPGKGR
jgi:hypothetical protein